MGSGGFGVTKRGRTGGNLATDKVGGQMETVLGDAEEAEYDMDWKALLTRCAWSILHVALYYVSGSVLAGHLYGIVAIWF